MKSKSPQNGPLFDILVGLNPDSSKTSIRSWIKEGRVKVDGMVIKSPATPVKTGSQIELGAKPKFLEEGVKILFQDRYFIVIDKPEGLLSVKTRFEKEDTLHKYLKNRFGRVFVIHRLDQGTSGVMVFGIEEEASIRLKKSFRDHKLVRRYHAIVEGKLTGSGTWTHHLFEDEKYKVHVVPEGTDKAQKAITHYKALSSAKGYTLVEFTLETGRKNQIRVQSSYMGHPVAGDEKYGARGDPLRRLALHASILEIPHPYTHKTLKFSSPVPLHFKKVVSAKTV